MSTSKTKSKGGKVSQVANGTSDHKNQPTAEQLRIARMAADKPDTDPEMMKKIKEISDLTGRSPDEAYTALHDCNGDANQAVDLLFEKVNHQDEWHEMKKKRKPTAANRAQAESAQNSQAADKSDNWENAEGQSEFHSRGRRDRGALRFARGAGRGAGRGSVNGTSNSRERTGDRSGAPDRTHDGTRGRRRGSGAGRPGGRNFRDRDNSFEPQNIEVWSNSIAENGKETESWNNNDEWANADDWDGSLEESLVLTRSVPAMNHQPAQMAGGGFAMNSGAPAEVVHQMTPKAQQQLPPYHYPGVPMNKHMMDRIQRDQKAQQQQQQDVPYNLQDVQSQGHHHRLGQQQQQGTDIASLSAHTSAYGSVIRSLVQGMPDSYSPQVPHSSAMYLSHYAKEATECIKNAVGIGSNNSPGRNMAAAGHHAGPLLQQLERSKTQQHLQQQQQHMKSKVPSKIPQSAVEMPGSMSSMQLDVQFGNWDSPSNAGLLSSGSQQNQSEMIQDKQGMNLQQYMSGNLPPTVASMSNLHVQNAHDTLHLKSTVEDMMGSGRVDDRRQAVAETVGSSGSLGSSGVTSGSGGACQSSATVEVSGGKMSFTSPPTPEDRKSHAFSQQQPPSGYGQMQSSSTTQMEKSLLSSTFQQQADQQGMGLGSLGLSSSLGNTPSTISNPSSSNASTSSGGSHPSSVGHSTADLPISASTPSQHPHHPPNSQLQYPYGLVRGSDGAAGNPSAYMYNQQFSKGYGGEKQPSSLVFDSSTNVSNLYQSPYHHMPSSAYPGSSGMYLGGGSSYLPSSNVGGSANVGSFHGSGSGAYQGGNLGSSGGESSAQAPPSFHHHPSSSSNYPSASLPGDGVFHNQSGHLFRNASFRSPLEQESFQRDGSNVGTGSQPSSSMSSGIPMSSGPNKLASDLSKLGLKDSVSTGSAPNAVTGGGQFDQASNMISVASLTTATNTTSSANLSTSVTSTSASVGTTKSSNSQLSLSSKSATQTTTGKHMMNYQGNVNLLNNYMISQPPGFQLAPFGYQHSQQALTGYAYEDMQAQHFNVGGSYVDVPFQMTNALQGRSGQQMSAQSQTFGGSDTKLTPLEPTQPGGSLQPQQPATGSASQQFHPYSGFNYINYIPGTGLMPYIPVMPMSGMAVPMPTNPALQASVPSSQYQQKPGGVYGSQHAFNMGGGQSQDFTKGFNQSQTTLAKSANGGTQASSHGDMLLASGSGFNKQHVQGFDKAGFHGGTPPSSFGLNVPGGTQTGTPGAGPAMYSGPFMPVMGHPNHSQILHHTMVAQEMSLGNRGAGAGQQKVGPNKSYNAPYWSGGN